MMIWRTGGKNRSAGATEDVWFNGGKGSRKKTKREKRMKKGEG